MGDGHGQEHQDRQWEQEAWGFMTVSEQVLTEAGRERVGFNQKEGKTFLVASAKQCENNAVGEFHVQYGWSTMTNADRKMYKSYII